MQNFVPKPVVDLVNMLNPVVAKKEEVMEEFDITVHMSSREYYSGSMTLTLPLGITEDDICEIEGSGYGEFEIWLNAEGSVKVENAGLEWTEAATYRTFNNATINSEWSAREYNGQYVITPTYDIHMEFCEVDENMVDDWETYPNG